MKTQSSTSEVLSDRYDVYYMNSLKPGVWRRWLRGPASDINECHKWIRDYGTDADICGMINLPGFRGITKFQIARLQRSIVWEAERTS